jgi:hypothetical protein
MLRYCGEVVALYVANKYRCTTAPLLDTPRRIGEESMRTRLVTPVVNKAIRDKTTDIQLAFATTWGRALFLRSGDCS